MVATRFDFILAFITVFSNFERIKTDEIESSSKKQDVPSSLDSRFFDLGGFINQLLPGFNQGNQPRTERNPAGIDFPGNSQFYSGRPIQNTPPPQNFHNQPNQWPLIDDAKNYRNQGPTGNVQQGNHGNYPNEANFGNFPQWQNPYPGVGNGFGQYPSQGGFPDQYPNQQQYPSQGGYPQNVNQPEFGRIPTNPYPNQGVSGYQPTPYPNQGSYGFPSTPFPNDGNYYSSPSIPYPEESDYYGISPKPTPDNWGGSSSTDYPNQGELKGPNNFSPGSPPIDYPNQGEFKGPNSFSPGSPSIDYPNQGEFKGPNTFRPGYIGDEGIDRPTESQVSWDIDIRSPNESLSSETTTMTRPQSQSPIEEISNENRTNAILGKPVIVPETTTSEGQIVFPDSTENAAQKQCVQDCQSSTEYDPVCGTDNITYINPGKFKCARNCGVHVFVEQIGRCPS